MDDSSKPKPDALVPTAMVYKPAAWLDDAVQRRVKGESFNAIAKAYRDKFYPPPTPDKIFSEVTRVLECKRDFPQEVIDHARRVELQRCDALQRNLWDKVEAADVKAVGAVLRVMERRAALMGLDAPKVVSVNHTFDWRAMSEEQLKMIADGADPIEVLALTAVN